jgi:LysR family hydrogen peroxide-inducible transcriptional activator
MELHQVKYFVSVAETLNFTRAAERSHVTQPALTRAIQRLEQELGATLLRRAGRSTHLTDFGRLLLPHFQRILAESQAMKSTAKGFLSLEKAAVSLGVMCTIGPLRAMKFLNMFCGSNPGVSLTVTEGQPERLTELLLAGTIDCAILAQPRAFDARLVSHQIYLEQFVVAFPIGHRFQDQSFVSPEDMSGESYLSRINCEFQDRLDEICRAHGTVLHEVHRSDREDWIQVMVASGVGVCFIPEFTPTVPGVMTRPLREPEVMRQVSIVMVSRNDLSPAVERFSRAMTSYEWGSNAEA